MPEHTKILFIDTNVFLQLRDLKDIPWGDLYTDVTAIDIMVAPRVIEELDRHKVSKNQRLRNRARLALTHIEQASTESDRALVLKEKPVRIRLVISTAPRFDWSMHSSLDPAKPDDQLVAEALSFGNGAEILSHDTGPRVRARMAGIPAHVPLEAWLLPTEQTDDQREISKLKRELEQVRSRNPKIIARFDGIDDATSELHRIKPVLRPLDRSRAQDLAKQYLDKHPRASFTPTSDRFRLQLGGISDYEANRYESAYLRFEKKVLDYFLNLHERVGRIGLAVAVGYSVTNNSDVAATRLRIEFALDGNASLLADRDDAEPYIDSFEMPSAPARPRSISDSLGFPSWEGPNLLEASRPRDPVAFLWFDRPHLGSKRGVQQCEDFRVTRAFQSCVYVLPTEELPVEINLSLHVSATNLAAPVNVSAKIVITERALDWSDPVVQAILPVDIR